jgi:alkanesulfonate monooxygenase SsuD/methylene tetrahydromethanopterin reductase-like flavin-dependent oxidoreductase (luciferase family)
VSVTTSPVKVGVLVWNQYTDWPAMRHAAERIDALGYDSLWTWDHLYPIIGRPDGPFLEGYTVLAGWSQLTTRPSIGLLVGANTFRNPALVVKMVTTLDHLSGGRAVLGIGAAWFETEHRLRHGVRSSPVSGCRGSTGGADHTQHAGGKRAGAAPGCAVRKRPPPVQAWPPLLIGVGRTATLRTVALYADLCNLGGGFENVRHKDEVLRRHCAEVGRDESEIERTVGLGVCVIRDTEEEARRVNDLFAHNGGARVWPNQHIGTPEQVAEMMRPYLGIGFRHFICGFPAPHDAESMERMITQVKPMLGELGAPGTS